MSESGQYRSHLLEASRAREKFQSEISWLFRRVKRTKEELEGRISRWLCSKTVCANETMRSCIMARKYRCRRVLDAGLIAKRGKCY
jgi:hypothetical protein